MRDRAEDRALYEAYERELLAVAKQPVQVDIVAGDVVVLIIVTQLAARHPTANQTKLVQRATEIAKGLQSSIAPNLDSPLALILERGWHSGYDQ